MSSPSSSSAPALRNVITTQDNSITLPQMRNFAASGIKLPNSNARRLVVIDYPRQSITRSDKQAHDSSRIGWGSGTYPDNYQVSLELSTIKSKSHGLLQILRRVLYEVPTREEFDEQVWRNDALDECHQEDMLWGYVVRAFEEFRHRDVNVWTDPVYNQLILMGCVDWLGPNRPGDQAVKAIRFSTALGSRIFHRIVRLEDQVGFFDPWYS